MIYGHTQDIGNYSRYPDIFVEQEQCTGDQFKDELLYTVPVTVIKNFSTLSLPVSYSRDQGEQVPSE